MSKITALRIGKGRKKRVNVFLDDRFAFSLEAEVVIKEGLQVGQELSASQIEALAKSDHFHRCLNVATHYLGYRPRSEFEVRERLQRRGFDDNTIGVVITRLKEQRLVDDMEFARFWKENRDSFSPRSQWLTRLELKQKGVTDDIIEEVVGTIDDGDSAYRAALSKARRLSRSDYQDFRHRLGEYLKRRGFGYGVINLTVERVWEEREIAPDSILP
jgi:regulatory protein